MTSTEMVASGVPRHQLRGGRVTLIEWDGEHDWELVGNDWHRVEGEEG